MLTPYNVEKSSDLSSLRKQLTELDAIQERYIDNITKNFETKKDANP
jgi:hypothetical protein